MSPRSTSSAGLSSAASSWRQRPGTRVAGSRSVGRPSRVSCPALPDFRSTGSHGLVPAMPRTPSRRTRPSSSRDVGIESDTGFEIGIELVAKARRLRRPVAEIPTIWLERAHGASNFKVVRWIPRYLRWYRFAFGPVLTVDQLHTKERHATWLTARSSSRGPRASSAGMWSKSSYDVATQSSGSTISPSTGRSRKSYDAHPGYTLIEADAQDRELLTDLLADCDHFMAGAALIGGISYFHSFAYDLLAENERIIAAACDAAIKAHEAGRFRRLRT